MGCEVNGPGEAKDADVGIAAGAGRAVIFRKGAKTRVVSAEDMLPALMEEVRAVAAGRLCGRAGLLAFNVRAYRPFRM